MLKIIALLLLLTACTHIQTVTTPVLPQPSPTPAPQTNVPSTVTATPPQLTWNSPDHPERAQWTADIISIITPDLATFSQATDITQFRPDWAKLSKTNQVQAVAEIFSSDSYYESGWDPSEADVDVGEQSDKNTWSVGLMQMSQCDQENYGLNFGFTYDDLITEKPNLILAEAIMVQQIKNYGRILIPWSEKSHVYWSSMSPGDKYDSSALIIKRVSGMNLQ